MRLVRAGLHSACLLQGICESPAASGCCTSQQRTRLCERCPRGFGARSEAVLHAFAGHAAAPRRGRHDLRRAPRARARPTDAGSLRAPPATAQRAGATRSCRSPMTTSALTCVEATSRASTAMLIVHLMILDLNRCRMTRACGWLSTRQSANVSPRPVPCCDQVALRQSVTGDPRRTAPAGPGAGGAGWRWLYTEENTLVIHLHASPAGTGCSRGCRHRPPAPRSF